MIFGQEKHIVRVDSLLMSFFLLERILAERVSLDKEQQLSSGRGWFRRILYSAIDKGLLIAKCTEYSGLCNNFGCFLLR